MPDTSSSWLPAVTALGGFLAGAITEYLRDRRAREREREARIAARRLQLSQRRTEFQRETLLSLQDEVQHLARAAGRIHHLDEMECRKTEKWGGNLLPEDLNDAFHEASIKTLKYRVRVRDDSIREMTKVFRDHALQAGLSRNREQASQEIQEMVEALEPLHDRIGLVLRKLDDDEGSIESNG